jgi:hypothetical protein
MAEGFSEFDGHSDQRAVNDEVEVRHFNAVAEVDVRRQRPVADVGGKRIAVELPRVAVLTEYSIRAGVTCEIR